MQFLKGKFLVALIIVTLLALVGACGQTTGSEPNQENSQPDPGAGESASSPAEPGEPAEPGGKSINIGYVTWAEDIAVTNLWAVILEEEGYDVKITQGDVAPIFTGLAGGDLDLFMDAWLPYTHASYWDRYGEDLEDLKIWYKGDAKIGLVVPTYVEADSIAELNQYKDDFGGRIVGIDPGAGIMKATAQAIENYGLDFELVNSSEAAMMAELANAYENEEAIAITGWSPHWMFAEYDLKYLDDPKKSYGEAEEIHTLGRPGFSEDFPRVAEWMRNFSMDDQQLGTLEAYINNEGMDPKEAAEKWIGENRDVVDGWLGR